MSERAQDNTPLSLIFLFPESRRRELMANESVASIINTAATLASAAAGTLAQLPGGDTPLVMMIHVSMIMKIAAHHGIRTTERQVIPLLGVFAAAQAKRTLSQWFLGWIPGLGNIMNASVAACLTQSIGWSAHRHFSK